MHPIYGALLRRPELLADHAGNYVALAKEEVGASLRGVAVRAACGALALVFMVLALGLTGVALMLGAGHGEFVWMLAIVPGFAWIAAGAAILVALRPRAAHAVKDLKGQLEADLAALRVAGEVA